MADPKTDYKPKVFTKEHHEMYEELRDVLMKLLYMGLPGADKMLLSLQKIHVDEMGKAGAMSEKMSEMGGADGGMMNIPGNGGGSGSPESPMVQYS